MTPDASLQADHKHCEAQHVSASPAASCLADSSLASPHAGCSGADPTKMIEDLAKRRKVRTLGVSMGQGQEVIARKLLAQATVEGQWVLLQNTHLGLGFLSEVSPVSGLRSGFGDEGPGHVFGAGGELGAAAFSREAQTHPPQPLIQTMKRCMHAKPGLPGCEAAAPLHACRGLELHSRETAGRREQHNTAEALNNAQQQPTC